jgi:hypothetical protein
MCRDASRCPHLHTAADVVVARLIACRVLLENGEQIAAAAAVLSLHMHAVSTAEGVSGLIPQVGQPEVL